jgi:uncharacterized phage-associated protein
MFKKFRKMFRKKGDYNILVFATYLLEKARLANIPMNVTKLQKLTYICYGGYWVTDGRQLLNERPEAWIYGPLFPTLHGAQMGVKGSLDYSELSQADIESLQKLDKMADSVLDFFRDWEATQLINWLRDDHDAWNDIWEKRMDGKEVRKLNNYTIRCDFAQFVSADDEEAENQNIQQHTRR